LRETFPCAEVGKADTMHFFDEVPQFQITQSTPIRTWDLSGYKEFNIHGWFRAPANSTVYAEIYFNNISGRRETINIPTIAIWTRTMPVFAPRVSLVLYNPSAPMDVQFRVYAACCPDRPRFRFTPLRRVDFVEARVLPTDLSAFEPSKDIDPASFGSSIDMGP
jgi:hypothetical protein